MSFLTVTQFFIRMRLTLVFIVLAALRRKVKSSGQVVTWLTPSRNDMDQTWYW
jgi:hypothetical protein